MRELSIDVIVKTRFATAGSLMAVVGGGIERGALRLPATIACGRTFSIALMTATGEVAVRGTVESLRHDGGATLVRFLSATDAGSNRDEYIDLDDVAVTVPPTLMVGGGLDTAAARARARDRGDWAVALGTPLPPEIPSLRAPGGKRAGGVRGALPPVPPPSSAPVPPALPSIVRAVVPPAVVAAPVVAAPMVAPSAPAPVVAAPVVAAAIAPAPVVAAPIDPIADARPASTLPPPLMAVLAPSGRGYYFTPAPTWPGEGSPDERARPTTLPPGWGPEQGRLWIPVMELTELPASTAAVAPPPTRAARGVLIASVVIATAGAAVAVSAVLWARSVSATRTTTVAANAVASIEPSAVAPPARVEAPAPMAAPKPVAAAVPDPDPDPDPVADPDPDPDSDSDPDSVPDSDSDPVADPVPVPAPVPVPVAAITPVPNSCPITITTNADRVGVFIDGIKRGETPSTLSLPCGVTTTVALRHPRYQEQTRRIDATVGGALHVDLPRPRAQLRIITRPAGATVVVDGRRVGRAPLITTVDGFERAHVTLSAPGMSTEDRRVYAKAGTTMVNVTLQKK